MPPPQLLPTRVPDGVAPGLRYRIEGELVPVLHVELAPGAGVFFEHHVVLYKDPALAIGMHPMQGAFKRLVAGMPILMTEARGPGEVAFSGTVKLSLLGTDGGPNVGNERRRGDRIRLVQALAPASTGPVRGGCVQSKLIGTVPRHPSASTQDCRAAAWSRS